MGNVDVYTEEQRRKFTVAQREMENKGVRVRNWRLREESRNLPAPIILELCDSGRLVRDWRQVQVS